MGLGPSSGSAAPAETLPTNLSKEKEKKMLLHGAPKSSDEEDFSTQNNLESQPRVLGPHASSKEQASTLGTF